MASLITLPQELILMIGGHLDSQRAINALVQTCRSFYNLLMGYHYQYNIKYHYCTAILSLSRNCNMRALQELLEQDDRMSKDIQDQWRGWHPAFDNERLANERLLKKRLLKERLLKERLLKERLLKERLWPWDDTIDADTDADTDYSDTDGDTDTDTDAATDADADIYDDEGLSIHVPLERGVYYNPLNGPAEAGNDDMVKLLLKAGACPTYTGCDHHVTFVLAGGNGHSETAKLLLRAAETWKLYIDNWDKYRDTPYWEVPYWRRTCRGKPYSDILNYDPSYWNLYYWQDCLREAVESGHEDRTKFLLSGIKTLGHYTFPGSEYILRGAIQTGKTKITAIVLEEHIINGMNHPSERKKTMEDALKSGNEEIVRLLIKHDHCTLSKKSYASVRKAAKSGNVGMLRFLHEHGLDLHFRDRYGRTALSYAAQLGRKAAIEFLITKDIDFYTRDESGWSALDWAVKRDRTDIINILKPLYAQQAVKKRKHR